LEQVEARNLEVAIPVAVARVVSLVLVQVMELVDPVA